VQHLDLLVFCTGAGTDDTSTRIPLIVMILFMAFDLLCLKFIKKGNGPIPF